jgi:aspartyl-tRNA(Asn)/glutamyl-tRNA(Gln) amidotransferase subunit B
MSDYILTVGMEVHVELKTHTKMFCGCANNADEKRPNANICPVCMAHPGTLPVPNRAAIRSVLRVGAAIGAELADYSEFDRKSYFYPDLPKGYQLSQYEYPFVKGGVLGGVAITRIHLEEDTARSQHDPKTQKTLIDYNRAGVPLMELVTEPVIHSGEQAAQFAKELQMLLRVLGVSHANMEKGEMRVEANISVSKDPNKLGTKVEVKNLNSFNSAQRAIEFEMKRHIEVLEKGGTLVQETRGWDENKQITFSQRKKEGSADYRYFPDPDLRKFKLSEDPELNATAIKATLPELPDAIRARYTSYGISATDTEVYLLDETKRTLLEATIQAVGVSNAKLASNYIVTDLAALGEVTIAPESFAKLIMLLVHNTISSRGAKDILPILVTQGGDPETIAKEKGLIQVSDEGALKKVVQEIVAANPAVVADIKGGKTQLMQFFVGQAMKALKGAGNPQLLQKLVKEVVDAQ